MGGDGGGNGLWDCKATAQCGAKGNFGWRSRCRACQRDRQGRPEPPGQRNPARSRWLDGPPAGQDKFNKLEKELEDLKKQLADKQPAGTADGGGDLQGGSSGKPAAGADEGTSVRPGPTKEEVDEELAFLNTKLTA